MGSTVPCCNTAIDADAGVVSFLIVGRVVAGSI
jgi:hypothetical protein